MRTRLSWLFGCAAVALIAGSVVSPAAQASSGQARPLPMATGDPRHPRQPRVPAACVVVRAALSTTTGQFSSADETTPPDTGRIQAALNHCAFTGRAVVLAAGSAGNSFLSGPLTIRSGEVLVVQDGATLYASLNPADYQIPGQSPANTCGTVSAAGGGCYPFITFGGSGAGLMGTRGADGSLGAIDGRGNGTLVGSTQTWWDVAAAAASGGSQNNPILVQGSGVNNITIYQVELENSPMYHVEIQNGHGLTVWGVQINSPATARNTDGVDPESESDVTIRDDMIQNGDDCVAVKANPGTPSRDITVDDVHCYGSHGLSVGSQTAGGVSNVLFENSTLDGFDSFGNLSGSDTGIQIKTDANSGGLTRQVTYRDICMTDIKHLLIFNPHYSSGGTSVPTHRPGRPARQRHRRRDRHPGAGHRRDPFVHVPGVRTAARGGLTTPRSVRAGPVRPGQLRAMAATASAHRPSPARWAGVNRSFSSARASSTVTPGYRETSTAAMASMLKWVE
jgi:polygalacturonase